MTSQSPPGRGLPSRHKSLRRPNVLRGWRFSISSQPPDIDNCGGVNDLPEEGGDLHEHFRTCCSLSRVREEFRAVMEDEAEQKASGLGLNACARPEESTGRLLLHSIGLNANLISCGGSGAIVGGGGSTAVTLSRVNQFVMQEVLPAYPAAIIEEDDHGQIPFTEAIIRWIEARRAVRKWKLETDMSREKVALVVARLQKRMGVGGASIYMKHCEPSDSDSEADNMSSASSACGGDRQQRRPPLLRQKSKFYSLLSGKSYEKFARKELKMIVDSSNDPMLCIDERGNILLANDASVKKFGYTKKELATANISILMKQDDAQNHGDYVKRYMTTGVTKVMGKRRVLTAKKKDGSTFQFELGLTEVNLGDGRAIFVGFCKDVSELKRHQSSMESGCLTNLDDRGTEKVSEEEIQRARGIPPIVEWCLTTLGDIVDNGGNIMDLANRRSSNADDDSSTNADDALGASFLDSITMNTRGSVNARNLQRQSSYLKMMDTIIVEKVAMIPHLLEELLLVEDPDARQRVFEMSIVKKVLFNTDSLGNGNFLIAMLDKSITVKKQQEFDSNLTGDYDATAFSRAFHLQLQMAQEECRFLAEGCIFYLERVSELNVQDDLQVFHHLQMTKQLTRSSSGLADLISTADLHQFKRHRDELFDAVGDLNGLIRRISVLEDDLVKRAAATSVIQRRLDRVMFSPFATIAAIFDGINHVLLMLSFRLGPAKALFHLSKSDLAFRPHQYLFASATLMSCVVYFGNKAIHTSLAKYALSRNYFLADGLSFWNLLDLVPLLMVLLCSVTVDDVLRERVHSDLEDSSIPMFLRSAVAITTPLLWLRILAFVKVRNKQLATLVLCSVEIMKDIKWFLFVLFVVMASFAQMWFSLTAEPDQGSQFHFAGYIKAYTMMLGDLDSDALQTHPLITILFVGYTFGVTIVFLNILIAIVSDSYQNSYVSSKMMLGKARIMFVSEIMSLKSFHRMRKEGKSPGLTSVRTSYYMFGTISFFHMCMITWTIIEKIGQESFCSLYAASSNRIIFEAVLIYLSFASMLSAMRMIVEYVLKEFNDAGGLKRTDEPTSWTRRAVDRFIKMTFSYFSTSFDSLFDENDNFLHIGASLAPKDQRLDKDIQRYIEKSKKHIKHELKGMFEQLQLSLREQENQHKQDMINVEERILRAVSVIGKSNQLLLQSLQPQRKVSYNDVVDNVSSRKSSFSLSSNDDAESRT